GLVQIFFGAVRLNAGAEAIDSEVRTGTIICGNANAKFGFSLAAANLDDDPEDELVVGAPGARGGMGMVLAFSDVPSNGGLSVYPEDMLPTVGEARFVGLNNGDALGHAVAAGDTTGDGKAEIVAS